MYGTVKLVKCPWLWNSWALRGEPTIAALLNGYIFEEPSKYLCLYLGSVLLITLVREVPLCSGQ